MIEESLSLPFVTWVLGQAVAVAKVDLTRRDQIVAICVHGKATQAIPILDLPMPDPPPLVGKLMEARHCRGMERASEPVLDDNVAHFQRAAARIGRL